MPKRVTAKERVAVTERAAGLCEYCLSPVRFATQPFSVEHINPRQKGGDNALDNLALACQGCNGPKHTKITGIDPFTEQRVPLYHPRQQKWSDHFAWSEDFTRVLGLTPTGRASVHVLELNRDGLMNLRRALHAVGQHPPEEQEEQGSLLRVAHAYEQATEWHKRRANLERISHLHIEWRYIGCYAG